MSNQAVEKVFPAKPPRSRAETKADVTDAAARTIIETEADRRKAKTERLRRARLEQEMNEPPAEPVKKRATSARKIKRVNCS